MGAEGQIKTRLATTEQVLPGRDQMRMHKVPQLKLCSAEAPVVRYKFL